MVITQVTEGYTAKMAEAADKYELMINTMINMLQDNLQKAECTVQML